MRAALLAFLTALILANPLAALDQQDRANVEAAVAEFEAEFAAEDWPAMLPPDRFLEVIADLTGSDLATVKRQTISSMKATMERADIDFYRIETDLMEPGVSPAGAKYFVMPSVMRISFDGGPMQDIQSSVVAVQLKDGWHLFRIEGAQAWTLFLRAYPQYEGIAPAN